MEEKDRTAEAPNDAFSSVLNGILSNPEMMSMVSSMAEKLKGGGAPAAEQPSAVKEELPVAAAPQGDALGALSSLAPLLGGGFGKTSKADDDRACLLRALKPYLSQGRCQAIEYIIKFSKLSDVLKNLS